MANQMYTSQNNQSVFDVCLQTYGDLNQMYKLLQDSGFSSILTYPKIGTQFTFDNSLISDYSFYNQLQNNQQTLNTKGGQSLVVFGTEDLQTIFISEDGTTEFSPES